MTKPWKFESKAGCGFKGGKKQKGGTKLYEY